MPSLRTPKGKQKYKEYLETHPADEPCALCERGAIKMFKYWKIIDNAFPYDLIASTHHMVVPLRHAAEGDLNANELKELKVIKQDSINDYYDWIIEATPKNKSIPGHFHLQLIIGKSFH